MTLVEAIQELLQVTPVMSETDIRRGLPRKGFREVTDADFYSALDTVATRVEPHWQRKAK